MSSPYYVDTIHRRLHRGYMRGNQLNSEFFPRTRYFGLQANPEFGKLRSLIDDRLFKIRHSFDINGNVRRLGLWDPPLDVGALVNAAAGAGSFDNLLQRSDTRATAERHQSDSMSLLVSGLAQVRPRQRFTYLLHKTFELCEELRRPAVSLLSTMEKKDGEPLQLLRSEQDTRLQRIMTEMKVSQKIEAERGLEHLGKARRASAHRLKCYSDLSGEDAKLSKEDEDHVEIGQKILLELQPADTASIINDLACDQAVMASILSTIPMPSINMEPMGVGVSEQLPSPAAGFQISAGLLRGKA
ncbi:hypothetical protein N0V92_004594 [Colletotrichum tropicale]|nr:hypothetical protein N0V92_004594 [Colletotrichum tropicale]